MNTKFHRKINTTLFTRPNAFSLVEQALSEQNQMLLYKQEPRVVLLDHFGESGLKSLVSPDIEDTCLHEDRYVSQIDNDTAV